MKKQNGWIIPAAVIAVLILVLTSAYTVRQNQYVVIRQWGKITRINDNPGLAFKIPFVQTAETITKETLFYDIPESDVITKDKKSMVVDSFVLWKVTDPEKFIKTLNAVRIRADQRIEAAVYNAVKNTISSMSQDEIIASRGESLTSRITEEANSDIGQYGVEILTAQIKTFSLPADNQEAVYARMISERENIAAGYEATGKSQAQKIRNETDRDVELLIAEAEKEAAIKVAEGEEEYMRILQDAYNSPEKAEFYEYIRGLDSLKGSMTGTGRKTLVLDKNSELVQILYGN
jgi:membrane protease subunit HflC